MIPSIDQRHGGESARARAEIRRRVRVGDEQRRGWPALEALDRLAASNRVSDRLLRAVLAGAAWLPGIQESHQISLMDDMMSFCSYLSDACSLVKGAGWRRGGGQHSSKQICIRQTNCMHYIMPNSRTAVSCTICSSHSATSATAVARAEDPSAQCSRRRKRA